MPSATRRTLSISFGDATWIGRVAKSSRTSSASRRRHSECVSCEFGHRLGRDTTTLTIAPRYQFRRSPARVRLAWSEYRTLTTAARDKVEREPCRQVVRASASMSEIAELVISGGTSERRRLLMPRSSSGDGDLLPHGPACNGHDGPSERGGRERQPGRPVAEAGPGDEREGDQPDRGGRGAGGFDEGCPAGAIAARAGSRLAVLQLHDERDPSRQNGRQRQQKTPDLWSRRLGDQPGADRDSAAHCESKRVATGLTVLERLGVEPDPHAAPRITRKPPAAIASQTGSQ